MHLWTMYVPCYVVAEQHECGRGRSSVLMNEGRRAWFERDGGDDGEEENGEEERGEEGDGIGLGRCERTGVEEELELEKEPRELSACSASICLRRGMAMEDDMMADNAWE